jgi:hypothetical protein
MHQAAKVICKHYFSRLQQKITNYSMIHRSAGQAGLPDGIFSDQK